MFAQVTILQGIRKVANSRKSCNIYGTNRFEFLAFLAKVLDRNIKPLIPTVYTQSGSFLAKTFCQNNA
jgi:hypothetical protein